MWEILVVQYGIAATTKSAIYLDWHVYREPDGPQMLGFYLWVLRRGDQTILVDTGFQAAAAERRGRQPLIEPTEALRRIGVAPDLVVLTHLHYDHTGNAQAFADVPLSLPAGEAAFWRTEASRNPVLAAYTEPGDLEHVLGRVADGTAACFRDGDAVAPGVTAVSLPGHTPGLSGLLVQTAGDPVLLCSDAVHLFDELELQRPCSIVCDVATMVTSFATIKAHAARGVTIVPGHDPAVMGTYPAVDGFAGVAARIA
jgi:glyoxylase-like metal-dependent hydrolase (beta-lactamase superfamily II)